MAPPLCMLAVVACWTSSSEPAKATEPATEVVLALVVNGVGYGDAAVVLAPGGDVHIAAAALRDARVVAELPVVDGMVSLAALGDAVRFHIDEADLALRLDVRPDLLSEVRLAGRSRRPKGLVVTHPTSGFLNYALHADSNEAVTLTTELGLRLGSALMTSTLALAHGTLAPTLLRGRTQIVIDDLDDLMRVTVGDTFASTSELGGATLLGGLTLSRELSLDPYLPTAPTLDIVDMAELPSTLDIYVDGIFQRRVEVPPGRFRVEDLAGYKGRGEVRYELRDPFGNTRNVSHDYYIGARALAPGLHDYRYSVGFERKNSGTESFDYRQPMFLGRHRFGVSDLLTLGWSAEAAPLEARYRAGASATFSTPIGEIELGLAAGNPFGVAGLLRYTYSGDGLGLSLFAIARTPGDRVLGQAPATALDLIETGGAVRLSGQGWQTSLVGRYAFDERRGHRASGRLGGGVTLGDGLSLTLGFGVASDRDGVHHEALTLLSWSPRGRVTAQAAVTIDDGAPRVALATSVPTRDVDDIGVQANADYDGETLSLRASPRLETRFLRASALLGYGHDGLRYAGDIAGGLAFVAGAGIFATRPIGEGFGVIEVPAELDVRGYRDNRFAGMTDDGHLFLPDLIPHYANRIAIDASDLGLEYDADSIERLVAPPYRGGVLVAFGVRRTAYVRGTLERDGAPMVYGALVLGDRRSALGDGGEFELDGLAPGHYEGEATSGGKTCRVSFEVPGGPGPIIDVGVVICAP